MVGLCFILIPEDFIEPFGVLSELLCAGQTEQPVDGAAYLLLLTQFDRLFEEIPSFIIVRFGEFNSTSQLKEVLSFVVRQLLVCNILQYFACFSMLLQIQHALGLPNECLMILWVHAA